MTNVIEYFNTKAVSQFIRMVFKLIFHKLKLQKKVVFVENIIRDHIQVTSHINVAFVARNFPK